MSEALPPLPEPDVMYEEARDNYDERYAFSHEAMREYASQAVLAERERCAKLCEATWGNSSGEYPTGPEYAAAIRAGTTQPKDENEPIN